MRILSIHNYYRLPGGEDEVFASEAAMLRQAGHQVTLHTDTNQRIAQIHPLSLAIRTVWSGESYRQVQARLRRQVHNLVHVHNFFPLLSPSVYRAAQDLGVPVVQTLHNYRLLCVNGRLWREGHVCRDCLGKSVPWFGIARACYQHNYLASATVATMTGGHRWWGTWNRDVNCYISLTEFSRQLFVAAGLPPAKVFVKPNFVYPDPGMGTGTGGYGLFVGRLEPEKGLPELLAAWEDVPLPLKVIGAGDSTALRPLRGVEFLGPQTLSQVYAYMAEAQVVLVPSTWYETFGRVIVEAFACGTPVIGSDHGAVGELIDHGRTGLKFRPGDSQDLRNQVEWMLAHPREWQQMRHQARAEFEHRYTAAENYRQLMEIYRQALN